MSEFMMLGTLYFSFECQSLLHRCVANSTYFWPSHISDNLTNELTNTPLLPVILNYIPPELVKASKTAIFKAPTRIPEKTGCIVLTEDDGINVEMEVLDTIDRFNLNMEQASVLRHFALTLIRAPGWGSNSQEPPPPILLVHGKDLPSTSNICLTFEDIVLIYNVTVELRCFWCRKEVSY